MRFLVLGAGALGGYYGGLLARGGAEVTFLVREARAAQLERQGLILRTPDGELTRSVRTVTAATIGGPYDTVLLACKSYDLSAAMEAVGPGLAASGAILPVLNGIDHLAILSDRFGAGRVLGGVAFVNGELAPDGVITNRFITANHLSFGELGGENSARVAEIHRAFTAGGVPNTVSADILTEMWVKFALYGAVAVIAILTRARAGEVAAAAAGPGLVEAAVEECRRVVAAEGYPPGASLDLVGQVYATAGSAYRPSVLVDVEQGKPTEYDHTLGDLVRRADRRFVPVPLLRAALAALQVHEARLRRGDPR